MPENILTDNDPHIHHCTNGDGDTGERHDIRIDTENLHGDETHKHRHREKTGDEDGTFHVHDHQENYDDRNQNFLGQCRIQRSERLVDKSRTVIERNDLDLTDRAVGKCLFGEPRGDLCDFLFDVFDSCKRIFTITDNNNTAGNLRSSLVERPTPQGGTQGNMGNLLDRYRNVFGNLDNRVFNILHLFYESDAANDIFNHVHFNGACTHIQV